MTSTKITQENFYFETMANFYQVKASSVKFKADYTSASGSQYMYTEDGVYRRSNHWGTEIASCSWELNGTFSITRNKKIGFCRFKEFIKYTEDE